MTAETNDLNAKVDRLASRQETIIRNQQRLTKSLRKTQETLEQLIQHIQRQESNDNHDN